MIPQPVQEEPPGAADAVLGRNIRALQDRQKAQQARVGWQKRLAGRITGFTGSMTFVYLHLAVFGFWVLVNAGLLPVLAKWDDNFIILGTSASIEVIFLSTFILISQNRMAQMENRRAELDLQVNLLTEHEVTRLMALVSAIAEHLKVQPNVDAREVEELKQDVAPERVLDKLEAAQDPVP